MKKDYLLVLGLVLIAGVALFFEDVLAALRGMTPLEMLQTLATYLLHIAIGTVAAVVIFGLPKVVKPWIRMARKNQRNRWRSGPNAQWQQKASPVRMPRMTAEQRFWLMMAKAGQTRRSTPTSERTSRTPSPRKLNIKW